MIADIGTIIWKEMKEVILHQPAATGGGLGKIRGGWISILIILGIYGILLPLQSGETWVENSAMQILWLWLPFILVSSVTADMIAGERERHTLETLLASRLSDRAILFGKVTSALIYGWVITLAGILAGLITVNITAGKGRLLMFPTEIVVFLFVMTFLSATMASGLGVHISLRAPTVRQAQQTMSLVALIPLLPLLLLPLLSEDLMTRFMNWATSVNAGVLFLVALLVLGVIDIVLLAWAVVRFQRSKLVLD